MNLLPCALLAASLKPYGLAPAQVWGTDPATGDPRNRRGYLREAVTTAAGIQTKRGDTISIGQVAFSKSSSASAAASKPSSHPGVTSTSLFSTTTQSALPALTPWFQAVAQPRFSEL